ncbi:CGNR zinc finger domain-containing protein [Phytomonospora sp. NPDC050363]|uniref:CGNR zinc finger domain-containing protein n=1 Tax=Phytomonospora sp. NPDC050363 TaxID=3155642 RepID=UPI0033E73B71
MSTRPLEGEPLALDLVDTLWIERDETHDLLSQAAGARSWLEERELPLGRAPLGAVRENLLETREAIRACLRGQGDGQARLNAVLSHGHVRSELRDGRPVETVATDDAAWRAAWLCARAYLDLLDGRPERIRKCANDACVLWFLDVSKNGRRRWCSMEGCGNRAKAERFAGRHSARS